MNIFRSFMHMTRFLTRKFAGCEAKKACARNYREQFESFSSRTPVLTNYFDLDPGLG